MGKDQDWMIKLWLAKRRFDELRESRYEEYKCGCASSMQPSETWPSDLCEEHLDDETEFFELCMQWGFDSGLGSLFKNGTREHERMKLEQYLVIHTDEAMKRGLR